MYSFNESKSQNDDPKLNWFQKWILFNGGATSFLQSQYRNHVSYNKTRKVWTVEGCCPDHGRWTKDFTVADMKEELSL